MLELRIALFLLFVTQSLGQTVICKIKCDGDSASDIQSSRSPQNVTASGRLIRIHISDEINVAFATIEKGQPGDALWIDRSFNGGISYFSGDGLGNMTIPNGQTSAKTAVFNLDGDIQHQEIGAVKACGKLGSSQGEFCTAWTRSTKYAENAGQAAATALMQLYNSYGLWEKASWWVGANCITALMNFMKYSNDKTYWFAIDTTYEKNKRIYNGNFLSPSVDDTAWWGLVWVQAYQMTGDEKYLTNAKLICDFVQNFTTSECGGGVVWSAASQYKNAITNELFIKLAASLHNAIPNDTKYLKWAEDYWNWFINSGMINENSLVNDGLTKTCENNKQTTWTYNQGVILGAAAELFKATNDGKYLTPSKKIAEAVIKSTKLSPNGILRESCEDANSCDADAPTFKGAFTRNLREFNDVLPDRPYTNYLNANAQMNLARNRNSLNQFGLHYNGPFESFSAAAHQSAFEAIISQLDDLRTDNDV